MRVKTNILQSPLYLLTVPLIFILNAANHYYNLLNWSLIVTPLLLYIIAFIPIYFIVARIFHSREKGAVYTIYLLFIFYFFAPFHQWIKELLGDQLVRYIILLPLLLITLIGLFIYLKKSKTSFQKLLYFLNRLLILLVVAGLLELTYNFFLNTNLKNDQADPQKILSSSYKPCPNCSKPDIYYILLDGYTNSKTLKNEFNYDNSEIDHSLSEKGFNIVTESRSNYNFTHMSMASIFNLNYLHHLNNEKIFYTKEFLQSYYTMYHNEWCTILKKEGYQIKNYSIFPIEDAPQQVTPFLTELSYRSVPGQTFFNKVNRDIGWQFASYFNSTDEIKLYERNYITTNLKRIEETFNGLLKESTLKENSPRFIYAHFVLPHEIFYFDSTGKRLPELYTARTRLNKKDYVNQVAYTNKFIITPLVDSILKNNSRPAIIIFQGDHGYRNYPAEKMQLEFENFNAQYFPGKNYDLFEKSTTSVNTFRIVLSTFFNQQLPLLKDSTINLMKMNQR